MSELTEVEIGIPKTAPNALDYWWKRALAAEKRIKALESELDIASEKFIQSEKDIYGLNQTTNELKEKLKVATKALEDIETTGRTNTWKEYCCDIASKALVVIKTT